MAKHQTGKTAASYMGLFAQLRRAGGLLTVATQEIAGEEKSQLE